MPMLTQQMEMYAASVGLLSVGKELSYTHTHTEDCLSISMHKGKSGIQVVPVCPPCFRGGVTALMVQFILISEYAGGGVCKSNMLRVMSSGKMTDLAIQSLCQLFP